MVTQSAVFLKVWSWWHQNFYVIPDMHNFTSMINSDLNNLRDWLKVNKLQFHLFEIKLMIIGSAYNPIQTWGGGDCARTDIGRL